MASRNSPKTSSPQSSGKQSSPGSVWPPIKCTPLCFESGASGCSNAGKHNELIMTLAKCSNVGEVEKTDFKKSLDKFTKTKWIRNDCVPEKNERIRFPLVHWACMLGKYKPLEYLVSERGFELTVKVGKNQQGPLHSMVQHLSSGLNPKSTKEYVGNTFGNILDVFLKYIPEALCEKDASFGDTILHYLAKRCSSDPYSRMYLKILLVKINESDKLSPAKIEEILSAVNKRGDSFLHLIVSDEESVDSLNYFYGKFRSISEKISKAKNNFGKTPRQIAVEKRSFEMLKALGAPDVVINSLKKAVAGKPLNPKKVRFADEKEGHKNAVKNSPATIESSQANYALNDTEDHSSEKANNGDAPLVVSSDQLQAEVLKLCACDPPADTKDQSSDSISPAKRTIEPFPQRYPKRVDGETAGEKAAGTTEDSPSKLPEPMEVDMRDTPKDAAEATRNSPDRNVFLSLSNTINSLTKGDSVKNSRKRPPPRTLRSRGSSTKRGRRAKSWSDSESDVEDDEGFALDDDSDDDLDSEEDGDEEEEEDKEEADEVADNIHEKAMDAKSGDDIELETAPKHTPFCRPSCTAQHQKLLLSLLRCSNYNYGTAHVDTFMKQVNEYITQLGKFAELRANADLSDPVASFKYPLVHWVCVLGKFKVLEKLAEMREFNLGVQSERTGETGLHRMLLSLDQAMVQKKCSVKTILEVFSKTLRTLTNRLPTVITVCNKEGDTPFHCLAKVILDCTGELEKMNTYEGYFEHLIKELTHLETSGKLTPEVVRELLLKTNTSQETFLHILACRHGVGHRVIKSVLKNIEPEIMAVLKEIKDADGKTPSDLAEELHSYEMAAILRPTDQDAASTYDDDAEVDLPQSPGKSVPSESPDVQSPPATLFQPVGNAMSPSVPHLSLSDMSLSAHVQLFPVKKEPVVDVDWDNVFEDPSEENSVGLNDLPYTSETMENLPERSVKLSPGGTTLMPTPPAEEDMDVAASSSASGTTESSATASRTNHIKSTSTPTVSASHSKATSAPTLSANQGKASSAPTLSANQGKATSVSANTNKSMSASSTFSSRNEATSSPSVSGIHNKNSDKESSVMVGIMATPQSDKLINTLHTKFQEQLIQSEKALKEKEDALVHVRQRITENEERRQKLLQELEETWNQMKADTREEGVIQSLIATKKRDCEKLRAELEKYESSLKAIRE